MFRTLLLVASLALASVAAFGQCTTPSFNAAINVRVGFRPLEIVESDFNGDGRTDFVVPSANSDKLRLLLGTASGVPTVVQLNFPPGRVAVADFNRDGKPDIAVTHGTFSTTFVSILLGDGAGGFAQSADLQLSQSTDGLLAADFNNDGKPDVFAGNSSTNTSQLLIGDGAGGFLAGINVVVPNNDHAAAGDFNRDGRVDLAVTNGGNFIHVVLGDGTGHFGPATSYTVDPTTSASFGSLAVADLNADNKLDLIGVGQSNGVSVLLGDGAGGFGTATSFSTGFRATAVAVGDFNADGKPDLAPAGNKNVALLLGNGAGGFGPSTNYVVNQSPVDIAAGDVNGDGRLDVATVNAPSDNGGIGAPQEDTATILLGDGTGKLRYTTVLTTGENPFSVAAGDLDGDGRVDLALANISNDTLSVLHGDGAGGFGAPTSLGVGTGAQPRHVIAADLNGDARLDLVTANFNASTVSILLANNSGGFGAANQLALPGSGPVNVAVGDFDSDGRVDLAVAYLNSGFVSILLGNGAGDFSTAANAAALFTAQQVVVNDFNSDGRSDLAVATAGGLAVLSGDGKGGFGAAQVLQSSVNFSSVAADDFNGDGKADIVASSINGNVVLVFTGDGQGGFSAPASFAAGDGPGPLAVADYNGDGKPDLATANSRSTVSVFLGDGAGGFAPSVGFPVPGPVPRWLVSDDFNADGRPDLAVADQGGNVVPTPNPPPGNAAVLVNQCPAAFPSTPGLSIGDVTVNEGDSGTTNATFTVSLSAASGRTVAASLYAAPQDALRNADFDATFGRVTFAPGATSQTVTVPVRGDALDEFDETFLVLLANPLGAKVVAGGRGTILDDDPPPAASIGDVTLAEGDAGAKQASFNVSLSAASGKPISISYATADGTAVAGTDYQAAAGTVTFSPGQTTRTISVAVNGDTGVEPDETFFVNLSNPVNVTLSDAQGQGVITDDDTVLLQFSQATYAASEGGHFVNVNVTRAGGASLTVGVDYATSDGTASERNDYATALGTLRFGPGETSKSFDVLITDDAFQEPDETVNLTLSNPTGGAILGARPTATVVIAADDNPPPTSNPIDESSSFVRQHYHDFLNREADASGLAFWTNEIESCGANQQCRDVKRINVSAAFFLSIEFQETGYLVYKNYKAAYGDATSPGVAGTVPVVRLNEFLSDTQQIGSGLIVGQGDWQSKLEANKQTYELDFVQRSRFTTGFPSTMTAEQFVDKLAQNAGLTLTQSERDQLIATLGATPSDASKRAQVLRSIAENPRLHQAEFNRAFVLMEYFGYLRRNPNEAPEPTLNYAGWKFWLSKLNQFQGNFVAAEMVKAFISSDEYRKRFGQ
jgi:Calx-beta domain/FG-GAP-like repeat/Domain of unknown function (DUF4214)